MLEFASVTRSVGAVLLVGNLLIICHELGHYLVARYFGIAAARFTIGFGPVLARHVDRRGMIWTLSLLPIGGYVGFVGDDDRENPGSFAAKPTLVRIAVIAAGPVANVVVAVGMFAAMLGCFGQPGFLPVADTVVPGSAAERAGIQIGDSVVAMDGQPMATFEDMRPGLRSHPGQVVALTITRGGKVLDLSVGLGSIQEGEKTIGLLGIRSTSPFRQSLHPLQVLTGAVGKTWNTLDDSISGLTGLVVHGQGSENLAGVVGVARLTGQVADQGVAPFMALIAILSANLALMNLVPIPVLDGGALLFCLAEMLLRRPVSERVQEFGTRSGFALLGSLFMMTTIHDLGQMGLFRWLAQL